MQIIQIQNQSRPLTQPISATLCNSFWSRFRGLMFRSSLEPAKGILLVDKKDNRVAAHVDSTTAGLFCFRGASQPISKLPNWRHDLFLVCVILSFRSSSSFYSFLSFRRKLRTSRIYQSISYNQVIPWAQSPKGLGFR